MITLKNREGTRVDLDITRDDASQIAPALARGWAFVEVVEQEITHEAPDATAPPAPKRARKPRAPKVAPAPVESPPKAPRAIKADAGAIDAVLVALANTPQKADAIYAAACVDKKAGSKALKALVADGRAIQHGSTRNTTYSIGTGAQS